MINIRLRIFLLAFVTISAVLTAFYLEYNSIQNNLSLAKSTRLMSKEINAFSAFIHNLQKERGLTAGHLINHSQNMHQRLLKQRNLTSKYLKAVPLILDTEFSHKYVSQLGSMQQRIDSEEINWKEVKEFYTFAIQKVHEQITLKLASQDYSKDISYELRSLSYLAIVRENLGLIRATLNRAYHLGQITSNEKESLNYYYGNFKDNLRLFESISQRHIEKTQDLTWSLDFHNEVFDSVIN